MTAHDIVSQASSLTVGTTAPAGGDIPGRPPHKQTVAANCVRPPHKHKGCTWRKIAFITFACHPLKHATTSGPLSGRVAFLFGAGKPQFPSLEGWTAKNTLCFVPDGVVKYMTLPPSQTTYEDAARLQIDHPGDHPGASRHPSRGGE